MQESNWGFVEASRVMLISGLSQSPLLEMKVAEVFVQYNFIQNNVRLSWTSLDAEEETWEALVGRNKDSQNHPPPGLIF